MDDWTLELENLDRWIDLGPPVSDQDQHRVDLLFLCAAEAEDKKNFVTAVVDSAGFQRAWSTVSSSFASYQVLTTNIATPKTSTHKLSAAAANVRKTSHLFYKLFLDDDLRATIANYDAVFWMQADVHPIRQHWVSELLKQARQDQPFWQRGSVFRGRAWDGSVIDPSNWKWTLAINGNALYASDSQEWRDFLTLVRHQESPDEFAQSFETSISRVFRHSPYTWMWQQKYSARLQYNDMIVNYGRPIEDSDIDEALANPQTFFIQGQRVVANADDSSPAESIDGRAATEDDGVEWNGGEVPASTRLSVLIRTWRNDLPYVKYTVKSIKKHLRNALETVIIMPEEDFDEFNALSWPPGVKLKSEPDLLPSGDIQQQLTKMYADKYCQGDFILHIDSDTVLLRPVLLKDVVWQPNRPARGYAPYSALPASYDIWREGTSFAVGRAVDIEFTYDTFHVYPRAIYAKARAHVKKLHGKTMVEFMQDRTGRPRQSVPGDRKIAFSEYNFLGAYAFYFEPELMTWVPRFGPPTQQQLFPILPQLVCAGNARIVEGHARRPGNELAVPYMRKMMDLASQTGNCSLLQIVHGTKAWLKANENDVKGYL
ncbi:hypothetical protein OIO90_005473 [Microbotryomycetes sp. JL221]|nr:hypothetical protein OIO90_005473 [Microbotryomycetes sp. JL221]